MAYKAVFSDVDGTLLNSYHQIPQETIETVQKLAERGIPFILVSARMPKGIWPLQHILGIKAPIICYSGALVLDESGRILFDSGLDEISFVKIRNHIAERFKDICCSFYSGNDWFVDDKNNPWIIQESKITGILPKADEFGLRNKTIHKLLCIGQPEEINKLEQFLKLRYSFLNIYKSKETYLEIISAKSSKSLAIKILQDKFELLQKELIAFGDHYNDIDMLNYAGLGIAMGNSPNVVKDSADLVTDSNDNDGVTKALNFYFELTNLRDKSVPEYKG